MADTSEEVHQPPAEEEPAEEAAKEEEEEEQASPVRRARDFAKSADQGKLHAERRVVECEERVRAALHKARFAPGLPDQVRNLGAIAPATIRFARDGEGATKLLCEVPESAERFLELLEKNGVQGLDLRGLPLGHPELRVLVDVVKSGCPQLRCLDLRGSLDIRGQPLYPKAELEAAASQLAAEHAAQYGPIKEEGEEEEANVPLEKLKEQLTAETGEEFTDVQAAFKSLARGVLCRADLLLDALAQNKTLHHLSLAENAIGRKDDGSRSFKQIRKARNVIDDHPTLRRLDLSKNNMGPKASGTLLKGLINNISLSDIDLSGNGLGEEDEGEEDELEGEDDPAFGEPLSGPSGVGDLLKKNKFVRSMSLRDNALKCAVEPPEKPVMEAEEEGQPPPPVPDDWDVLTDDHKEDPFCKMVLPLAKFQRLSTLDLSRNELGVGGAYIIGAVLRSNTSLTSLNLGENQLGPLGVKVLAEQLLRGTGALKKLGLARNDFAGLKGKKKNRQTAEAVQALAAFLESDKCSIEELDLAYNVLGPDLSAQIFTALAKAPKKALRVLDVEMNNIAGASSGDLTTDGDLTEPAGVEALCSLLESVPLTDLRLQWNFLQAPGSDRLAKVLATQEVAGRLLRLDLSRNYLGPVGVSSVCDTVSADHALADLRLTANAAGRGEDEVVRKAASSVSQMLMRTRKLTNLDLSDNALSSAAIEILKGVAQSALRHLSIASNGISTGAAPQLASAIRSCPDTLASLDAGDNDWGPACVLDEILPALKGNTGLRRLAMWGGEHSTPQNPTTPADLAEGVAKVLAEGKTATGLVDLDLGLPLSEEAIADAATSIASQLRSNYNQAEFKAALELCPSA